MTIWVNDEPTTLEDAVSLAELLALRAVRAEFVAVALNGECVPRAERERVVLAQDDRVEILTPHGGG